MSGEGVLHMRNSGSRLIMSEAVIVLPCYNEAARLSLKCISTFARNTDGIALLFVNDGSRDETLTTLHALQTRMPEKIDVLDLTRNVGKAEAVRSGMLKAITETKAAYVGFWDADLATPLEVIPKFTNILAHTSVDMVFGSRVKLLGRNIHRRALRHYLGRVFATASSMTLRLPIYDTQCGAKLFRNTPELATVLKTPFLSRWIFDVEIIARFVRLTGIEAMKNAIYEYPLETWTDVEGSKVRPEHFLQAISELARIHLTY